MGIVARADRCSMRVAGLADAAMGDVLAVGDDARALAFALEREEVVAALLSGTARAGDAVRVLGALDVPCGPELGGRIVDPFGRARDGRSDVAGARRRANRRAASLVSRRAGSKRLASGVKALDILHPTLAGDRVLFCGPNRAERRALLLTFVRAQAMRSFFVTLTDAPVTTPAAHTTHVVAGPSSPPALRVLAPSAAMAMAEAVRDEGADALVVIDDLGAWADAIRELVPRVTTAEIFSLRAAVLDRAGGHERGSITVLAADEARADGAASPLHPAFFMDRVVKLDGGRPHIPKIQSKLAPSAALRGLVPAAGFLRLDLAQWAEVKERVAMVPTVDRMTRAILERGERLVRFLEQPLGTLVPAEDLVLLAHVYATPLVNRVPTDELAAFDAALLERARLNGFRMDPNRRPTEDEIEQVRRMAREILR